MAVHVTAFLSSVSPSGITEPGGRVGSLQQYPPSKERSCPCTPFAACVPNNSGKQLAPTCRLFGNRLGLFRPAYKAVLMLDVLKGRTTEAESPFCECNWLTDQAAYLEDAERLGRIADFYSSVVSGYDTSWRLLKTAAFKKSLICHREDKCVSLFVTFVSCFRREVSIIIRLIKITLKTNVDFLHQCLQKLALDLGADAKAFNISVLSFLGRTDRYIKNKQQGWQNFTGRR